MKIGIDLGGSHIAVGLTESNGNILSKKEVQILKEDEKNITDIIENYICTSVAEITEFNNVEEIGIAIPGTIGTSKVVKSVNLGLEDYDIVKELNKKINLPIKIKNDAKCAAIAENTYGSLKQYSNSVFLTLGTGIGGAVFFNNKLLSPDEVPGFEFGHMVIKQNGRLCKCGKRGCFEQYGSMRVFKERIIEELQLDPKIDGEELLKIVERKKNNTAIIDIIDEYTTDLSVGISNLINIFEPHAIGIGGSFVYFDHIFLPLLKDKLLNGNLLFNKREDIIINTATLGNDAGMIGATLI
ncbi:MAG: ROK family protein [Clostridia bacterium]|nr:ROK family protein [Clostridia bacterium]